LRATFYTNANVTEEIPDCQEPRLRLVERVGEDLARYPQLDHWLEALGAVTLSPLAADGDAVLRAPGVLRLRCASARATASVGCFITYSVQVLL
jgi:hypothetical protein